MHHGTVTIVQLMEELEGCDPDAEVRLAQQPAWPFAYSIDPGNAAVQVELDDTTVVDIGEGEQLGYLPETVRQQLGWWPQPATSKGAGDGV